MLDMLDAVFGGVVVPGHGRGHGLGFPTANVAVACGNVPPDGVYSCWVRLPDDPLTYGATVSVGTNPTFDDVEGRRVEAYLHDFDGDLYGRMIEVRLVLLLRPTSRFRTVAELIAQTENDVRRSREVLRQAQSESDGRPGSTDAT